MLKINLHIAITALFFIIILSPAKSIAQTIDNQNAPRLTIQDWTDHYGYGSNDSQQKIDALGNTPVASVLMPVLFGIGIKDISPNFGASRDGGARTHEGEDIMAIKGDPIVSPTPAVVLRAGTGGSEGIYVYTINPGGETFVYYHLDRIGENIVPGLVLAPGALIGYVGNTGNASGGAAHLHFEIHNNSGNPTDPFPRLTSEFTLQEKMDSLSTILTQTTDTRALAEFLVSNFRSTFNAALSEGVVVPAPINFAMLSTPVSSSVTANKGDGNTTNDLDIGSSGTPVVTLQKYLIQANSGPAAMALKNTGATGYFGTLTKNALMEYQKAKDIYPASGYYGSTTREYIASHPLGTTTTPTNPIVTNNTNTFTRDLYREISGEDVRALQKLLNTHGYPVALSGEVGSLGHETTYFGSATEAAVIKFQIGQNISPASGYVGTLTRAALLTL